MPAPAAGCLASLLSLFLPTANCPLPTSQGFHMLLQRRRAANALRHDGQRLNPLYGYGYRPDWPSILSIAHDVSDGGRLFIITDRPCALLSPSLPLEVAGLSILGAATTGVVNVDASTLGFNVPFASEGSTWSIVRQPAWITTLLTVPQGGGF